MPMILVSPLAMLDASIAQYRPSHLVSILSASHMIETPGGIEHHLRLCLSDIATPTDGLVHPTDTHIERLIAFGAGWDGAAPLIVHCWAGVSRSMAAAFILWCARLPGEAEGDIAKKIRAKAAHANPNRLMVGLADRILGRDGRMIDAVDSMGRAQFVEQGVPVEFSLERFAVSRKP